MRQNDLIAFIARPEWFIQAAEWMATFIEAVGIVVIVVGGVVALARYPFDERGQSTPPLDQSPNHPYRQLRRRLGRSILLGLEFLVAADIIGTVLISPTLSNVTSLGVVVLIRTFLSWSMEMEVEGRWPWQKQ